MKAGPEDWWFAVADVVPKQRTFAGMNYILTVPDERKAFLEELVKAMPFLKARPISGPKAEHINDVLDAIEEMKAIEAGKRKPRSAKAMLRELCRTSP